jgi:beta-galactosidase
MSIADGNATVHVRTKLKSDSRRDGTYGVRVSLLHADGAVAESAQRSVSLQAGESAEVDHDLTVVKARLWQGVEDPYQYKLVAELLTADGTVIDNVVQDFGIRQVRFDPDHGFYLNDKYIRLRGVAIHQDYLGKGWAMTNRDVDESLALVKEIGANAIRLGHYPFSQYVLAQIDKMGLVAWAEVPFSLGVTPKSVSVGKTDEALCPDNDPTESFKANARQQLQEMIRQQYNHAAVAMWSIGNETTFMARDCPQAPYDNITPLLRELNELAKKEDSSRPTTLADLTEQVTPSVAGSYIAVGGITDIWATNRYYPWYDFPFSYLGELFDALHARYPLQPIGLSEYGAGGALTHHTDNPLGGPPESSNTGVPVVYQPEEYQSYFHGLNYELILSKKYLWGSYVWTLFDFGSGLRNEGDLLGVNTKGLVTFDRKIKKDPFYFYKANWSSESVTYITERRYVDRAYALVDVKVFSNADSIQLSHNGRLVDTLLQNQCVLRTCMFRNVTLNQGDNKLVAVGNHGGKLVSDSVTWSFNMNDVNIAAGQLATGFKSSVGARFGSDNFFTGGQGDWLVEKGNKGVTDRTAVCGTLATELFKNYRRGRFSYDIPLADGQYVVTLGFLEPDRGTKVGARVFDVAANSENKVTDFDILAATRGVYRTATTRSFQIAVTGGRLKLEFIPRQGEAVVSNIMIAKQGPDSQSGQAMLANTCDPASNAGCARCLSDR